MCSDCTCSVYVSCKGRGNGSAVGSCDDIDSGGGNNRVCGNGVDIGVASSIGNYNRVVLD